VTRAATSADAVRAALEQALGPDRAVGAQFAPLPGGTHRRSWLVTLADGRRNVLRLPVPHSSALLDVTTEARAMDLAARAGLAPPVVTFDAGSRVLVTEYRPGTPWTVADARHPQNFERLAAVLRSLHALPAEVPPLAAERVAADYLAGTAALAREAHATGWGDELLELARRYDGRYAPTVFCHNDLVAANVLDDGKLALVDFEYAVRAEPLLDLANLAAMNGFNGAEQRALLAAYRRVTPTTAEVADLAWLVRMVRLMAWFWALLGNANAEDAAYAQYLAKLGAELR
jgi:Ser/Thr protein kinase RdoA (MazF antagonist)